MKHILLSVFVLFINPVYAQVDVSIENTYVNDGALGMVVRLTNSTTAPVAVQINDTKTLLQLALPQKGGKLDLMLQSQVPVTFVLFYDRDKLIDEPVMVCDSKLPGTLAVSLKPGETYSSGYEGRCFSESVIRLLNSKKQVQAQFYMVYRMGTTMYVARSTKKKIKVKK